jgi:hypothetical protein
MMSAFRATPLLFAFFFEHARSTFRQLPAWLRNPPRLDALVSAQAAERHRKKGGDGEPLVLTVPNEPRCRYEVSLSTLKAQLRTFHKQGGGGINIGGGYKTTMCVLFLVRLATCYAAWSGAGPLRTLGVSLLQFLFAPYSFFVSFSLLLALGPPHFLSHYAFAYAIGAALPLTTLTARADNLLSFQLDGTFALLFFVVDFLLCCWCHFDRHTRRDPWRKTLTHVCFGFLNCKTYYVVLFGVLLCSNFRLRLLPLLLDAAIGATPRLSAFISDHVMHWSEIFYHQHRMAHLPKVYEHAHKMHHYLHGSTAFDAHVYSGNGMPEEWWLLAVDVVCTTLLGGANPAFLNFHILWSSWTNKVGHTEQQEETCGNNFHPDHHIYHRKNYGIYNCLMDAYFETCVEKEEYNYRVGLYLTDTGSDGGDEEAKEKNDAGGGGDVGGAEETAAGTDKKRMKSKRKAASAARSFLIRVERDEIATRFLLRPARGYW